MSIAKEIRHGLEIWVVRDHQGYQLGMFFSEQAARSLKLNIENHLRETVNKH
jgi:hypothetical protein